MTSDDVGNDISERGNMLLLESSKYSEQDLAQKRKSVSEKEMASRMSSTEQFKSKFNLGNDRGMSEILKMDDQQQQSQPLAQQMQNNMVELVDSSSENVAVSHNRLSKNMQNILDAHGQKSIIDDDEEGKCNPQGGGTKQLLPQKAVHRTTTEAPEEIKKCDQGNESDSVDWGHKYTNMVEDDAIYEMPYQDGNKKNSVKILISDFNRLEPSVYLNDTLILFFLKFLQNYVLSQEQVQKIHIFNSFFMQMITQNTNQNTSNLGYGGYMGQGGYNPPVSSINQKYDINFGKMKRWTRSIDLFNGKIQYIFVPICENEHWSLAIICQPEKAGQLIEQHIKWCEDGKVPKTVEKETKNDKTHSPPSAPGDKDGGNNGMGQPSTSSVTQKSQTKSNETPPPSSTAQNQKKAHNYRDQGEEAAAMILENDDKNLNIEYFQKNPPLDIDEADHYGVSEEPIFLPENEPQIPIQEEPKEPKKPKPKFLDKDLSNDLSKDLGIPESTDPNSLRSRLKDYLKDNQKEEKMKQNLEHLFQAEQEQQQKQSSVADKNSSSVLIFDQITSSCDKFKKQTTKKSPVKKSINAAEFLEATEDDIHKFEDNPTLSKIFNKKDSSIIKVKDKKKKLFKENPPKPQVCKDKGIAGDAAFQKQFASLQKPSEFSSLIDRVAQNSNNLKEPALPPSMNKLKQTGIGNLTSCISKNVGQKRVSPHPEMNDDLFEKELGLHSSLNDSNKMQKIESQQIKINFTNQLANSVPKIESEKKSKGSSRQKVEKLLDLKKSSQYDSMQNLIGSEAERLINDIDTPGNMNHMDYREDFFNTTEQNDSFNVGLHDFNNEKGLNQQQKKPRQKQPKEPKDPKVKGSKTKKKEVPEDYQYHSSLQGASQSIDQMNFVEPPKKKKKSKSKAPSVKKMASPDQIGVIDGMNMPEMGPPADYTNGSCSTMASPIQEEKKLKKQKKPKPDKPVKKREKKAETTGLKISHQPPGKKLKEDRMNQIASTNPYFDTYGISDMCNAPSYYDRNKEGGGGGGHQNRMAQNDSSIVEANDDVIQTGHVRGKQMNNFDDLGSYDRDSYEQFGSHDSDDYQQNLGTSFKKQSKKMMNKPGMPFKIKDSNMGSDEVMIDEDMEHRVPKKHQPYNKHNLSSNQNTMRKYLNRPEGIEDSDEEMRDEESRDNYGSQNGSDTSEERRFENSKKFYPGQKTLSGMVTHKTNDQFRENYDYSRKMDYDDQRHRMSNSEGDEYGEEGYDSEQNYYGQETERADQFDNYLNGKHSYPQKYKDNPMGDYDPIYHTKPVKKAPEMPGEVNKEQPFILYLDSLNRVNTTNMQCLRQYIEMEYIDKKLKNDASKTKWLTEQHGWKGLTSDVMPHYQPTVPMQKNYTDCGLYLLENAETFIKDPEFIQKNLHQKDVRLFKTRLVEDKRDILRRVISALATHKDNRPDNTKHVGSEYQKWREELYQKMTHYEDKKKEEIQADKDKAPKPDEKKTGDNKGSQNVQDKLSRKTQSQKKSSSSSSSSSSSNSQNQD